MKVFRLMMSLLLVSVLFTQCMKDELTDALPQDLKSAKKDAPPKGMF